MEMEIFKAGILTNYRIGCLDTRDRKKFHSFITIYLFIYLLIYLFINLFIY